MFSNCLNYTTTTTSFLSCLSRCNADPLCQGTVKDTSGKSYFYSACGYLNFDANCSAVAGSLKLYVYRKPVNSPTLPCGSGGTYSSRTTSCVCQPGWSGVLCDEPSKTCANVSTSGVFWTDLKLSSVVRTICDVTNNSEKIHAFRNDGKSYHNKTWAEFVKGYAIDDSNFWIGLDNMRALISSGFTAMRIFIQFSNTTSLYLTWTYSGVAIQVSTFKDYALTYSDYKCDAKNVTLCDDTNKNCIVSGKSFSTIDKDNDWNLSNLAQKGQAGWWYDDTSWFSGVALVCNPLGRLPGLVSSTGYGKIILPGLDMSSVSGIFQHVGMYFYR